MTQTQPSCPGATPGRPLTRAVCPPARAAGRADGGRRGGFTLVEILVVIGIIVVLVGLASVAFVRLDPSGRATKVTLESCRAMLAELDSADGLTRQPPVVYWNGTPIKRPQTHPRPNSGGDYSSFGDFWRDPFRDNTRSADPAPPSPRPAPSGANSSFISQGRLSSDIVKNTNQAMYVLMTIPANSAAVGKMSQRTLEKWTTDDTNSSTVNETAYPLPLDGWGNPIVFVPASGLTGVTTSGATYTPTAADVNLRAIRAPDGRPFFASAGPDNDLSKGDDNIYSFQN